MSTDIERVMTEPHLVLSECGTLFNNHELLADVCHTHSELELISYLSARVEEVIPHAPEISFWQWNNDRDHRDMFKIIRSCKAYLTPRQIWLAAGFSKGELTLFLESFAKAQDLLNSKQRRTTVQKINDHNLSERRHIDTAKIRARKKP